MIGLQNEAVSPTERTTPRTAFEYAAATQFSQGTALLGRRKFVDAEACLREALKFRPDHAETLNNLGTTVWHQGRTAEAEDLYRRAYELNPVDFAILNNLGNVLWEHRQLDEAADFYNQALALRPTAPETLMNLGVVPKRIRAIRRGKCLHPPVTPESTEFVPGIRQLGIDSGKTGQMGGIDTVLQPRPGNQSGLPGGPSQSELRMARPGRFRGGWPEYEWRLSCRRYRGFQCLNRPRWDGGELYGKSVLLHSEQGFGDTLQFIRYARSLKQLGARTVLVYCAKPLTRLLGLCPEIDRAIPTDSDSPLPDFDVHSSVMSLPALTRTTLDRIPRDVPYLWPDRSTTEFWRPIVEGLTSNSADGRSRLFRIGVAWQGNPLNGVDRWRSFPLKSLAASRSFPA